MKFIKFLLRSIVSMLAIFFMLFVIFIFKDNNKPNYTVSSLDESTTVEATQVSIPRTESTMQEGVMEGTEGQPEKPKPENKLNKFYVANLNNYSKMVYISLEEQKDALKKGNKDISISSSFGKAIEDKENIEAIFSAAVNAFEYDNPEIFYLDLSKLMLYYETNGAGTYKVYLKNTGGQNSLMKQFSNENGVNDAQGKIDEVVNTIKEDLNNLDSDYDKVLYIHDWLTQNVKYDETTSKTNKDTIYGVFVEKEAVCGGYAKAFKYLLDMENINTIIIQGEGTAEGKTENHAWNYVQLDGNWYGVDCTWDDPILVGNVTENTQRKFYTYFLKGKDVFDESHKPFENFFGTSFKIEYPELSENNY